MRECTDGYFSGRVQCRYRQLLFVEPLGHTLAGMNEEELRLFLSDPSQWKKKMIYEDVLGVSLLRWTGVHLGLGNM